MSEIFFKSYLSYFENFSEETVDDLLPLVSEDVYFKDPFNELRSASKMHKAMRDIFEVADDVRFVVLSSVYGEESAYIKWDFYFKPKKSKASEPWKIRGLSEVSFAGDGKIRSHIDYWDAAENFYEKLPVIGSVLRFVKRRLRVE